MLAKFFLTDQQTIAIVVCRSISGGRLFRTFARVDFLGRLADSRLFWTLLENAISRVDFLGRNPKIDQIWYEMTEYREDLN